MGGDVCASAARHELSWHHRPKSVGRAHPPRRPGNGWGARGERPRSPRTRTRGRILKGNAASVRIKTPSFATSSWTIRRSQCTLCRWLDVAVDEHVAESGQKEAVMRWSSHGSCGLVALIVGAASCSSELGGPHAGVTSSAFSVSSETAREKAFTLFETGQTRPLALSGDGRLLYATNTPDNRLEIFRVGRFGLLHVASVPVGLEPLAVGERENGEVWVVNHLSDSVSVVDARDPARAHVVRTLLVGDEPRDIVFAGPDRSRAFIKTAHRGQNSAPHPELPTTALGAADIRVLHSHHLSSSFPAT